MGSGGEKGKKKRKRKRKEKIENERKEGSERRVVEASRATRELEKHTFS